ncbi:MAG: hypothetical protein JWM87_3723 [Candidatus Eremiobacteraeota bacterium]|nr:hypothetical protein [Candidatus Eremiobacteraeota bacterium]
MNAIQLDAGTAAVFGALGPRSRFAVADVSLGSWRPRHIAHELAAQLSVELNADERVDTTLPDLRAFDYGAVIGRGVDTEARGDPMIMRAFDDARAIAHALDEQGMAVVALGPRFGARWRAGEVWFLRFLRQLREGVADEDVLLAMAGDIPRTGWHVQSWDQVPSYGGAADALAVVPGILDAKLAPRLGGDNGTLVELRGGVALVPPERRCARPARAVFDRLGALASDRFVSAYCSIHGTAYFADPARLIADAWAAYAEHAFDLALEISAYAAACATSSALRAAARASALGMAIATRQYQSCAEISEAPPDAPRPLQEFIREGRAWGRLMCGDVAAARIVLDPIVEIILAQDDCRASDLYRLNIAALAQFRDGDRAGALVLERAIEERIAAMPTADARLAYINHLNLARVLRANGDRVESERHYHAAFATSDGLRGTAEHVQRNAILGGIAEDRGDADAARSAWFRAALHWLAHQVPEAVGPRVVSAVTRDPSASGDDAVARTSKALLAKLVAFDAGTPRSSDGPVAFSAEKPPREAHGVGAPGWAVLVAQAGARPRIHDEAFVALGEVVGRCVRHAAGGRRFDTAFVYDRHGREIPVDAGQAREAYARCARSLRFDDRELSLSTASLLVKLGPGVASVDERLGLVHYNRLRPPFSLEPEELDAVTRIRRAPQPLAAFPGPMVRRLEDERIVVLQAAESACI